MILDREVLKWFKQQSVRLLDFYYKFGIRYL